MKPIPTGTFVQGWLAASYSQAQWEAEFESMRDVGFDHLILQTSLDDVEQGGQLSESWAMYPSQIPGVRYRNDGASESPIERILALAESYGMAVYLGLNLNERAWFNEGRTNLKRASWGASQAARGNLVAQELADLYLDRFPNSFRGWYWAWEIDNTPVFKEAGVHQNLVHMLNTNLEFLAGLPTGLPTIISCFYNALPEFNYLKPNQYADVWNRVLSQVPRADQLIFAPQDGVGADHVRIADLDDWFRALGMVARAHGAQFWANCETFKTGLVSAPFSRCIQQFQAVAPFVDGMTCFAYSHYNSPQQVDPNFHQQWIQYRDGLN